MAGPSSAVRPGTRKPFGPVGTLASHYVFTEQDLDKCYPRPQWVADRLRLYPQRPVGNSLRDSLPTQPVSPARVPGYLPGFPRPGLRPPHGGDAPYGWAPPGEFVGPQLEDELPPPERFYFRLELLEVYEVKAQTCRSANLSAHPAA